MKFPFSKMHGLGNDFVVFDFTEHAFAMSKSRAVEIADRHFGVGCDQILMLEHSIRANIDFKYRILNADGGEVGQCGNGARCVAAFAHAQGLTNKAAIRVETLGGDLVLRIDHNSGLIAVEMGVPKFSPNQIPLLANRQKAVYQTTLDGEIIEFSALSIGNPHAVITVDDVHNGKLERWGARLESLAAFPERANIGFMQVLDRQTIRLRVFERGVGETIACGSGACAAVVSGIQAGSLDNTVITHLAGGDLTIDWPGVDHPVVMTGPTKTVFTGEIDL